MRRMISERPARGFTLVELILVMVIISIIAGAIVLLVRRPIENYVTVANRAELADAAESALRLMARDLRSAVSNSVRITTINNVVLLEFIPSVGGGRYLDAGAAGGTPLNFQTGNTSTTFTALTVVDGPVPPILVGDYLIISNYGTGFPFTDAYQVGNGAGSANGNRAIVRQVVGSNITIDDEADGTPAADSNVFGRAPVSISSPTLRFSIARQPVSYRCVPPAPGVPGKLWRVTNYGFKPNQIDPGAGGLASLVAQYVQSCNFVGVVTAYRNTSLLTLSLVLRKAGPDPEPVALFRQIHLDNTP